MEVIFIVPKMELNYQLGRTSDFRECFHNIFYGDFKPQTNGKSYKELLQKSNLPLCCFCLPCKRNGMKLQRES